MKWNQDLDDCDESKWNRGKWINRGSEREDRLILSENCRRDMEVISSIMESQAVDLSFLKEVLRIFSEEDRREKDELLASLLQLVQEQNALLQIMKIPPTDLKGVDSISTALRVLREKTTLLHHSFSQPSSSTHQTLFRVVRIGVILIPLLAFLWLLIATPDSEVFYSFYVSQQTPEEYCYNYCCCSQD